MFKNESPKTRGIFLLHCAITNEAFSIADFTISTLIPKLKRPCRSGKDVCIKATSMGIIPRRNKLGTSDKKIGV